MRFKLVLAGIGGLGLVVAWLSLTATARRPPEAARGLPPDKPSYEQLSEELAALKRDVSLMRLEQAARDTQPPPSATAMQAPRPTVASSDPRSPEEMRADLAKTLEAAYRAGARDRRAGGETTRKIESMLGNGVPGTKVASCDCTGSMCRVILEHEDETQQRESVTQLVEEQAFDGEAVYFYDTSVKPARTTVYVTREGHLLAGNH
jgi:hypothetical protein